MVGLALLLFKWGGAAAASVQAAGPPPEPPVVLDLELRGVGQLSFGERFEWQLVIEPPREVRAGQGILLGPVVVRSASGAVRHVLPEPPGYSYAENGGRCGVLRAGRHAVLRCARDYVFDLRSGAPPVLLDTQFNDRSNAAPPWLQEMPLPWWRTTGAVLGDLLYLEYGYTNYGQAVETTEHTRGPALLELATGRMALARVGRAAAGALYDASAAEETDAVALYPERVLADRREGRRRIVTVATVFDRCVAARCRSDEEPGFRRSEPLTFVFE